MEWKYSQPVTLIFGSNKLNSLYDILNEYGLKNGLLVCDPFFAKNGLSQKVLELSKGLIKDVFFDITPNPTVENVDCCADIIRKNNIEFLVALGGGSSLDCAKASASICKTDDSIREYIGGGKVFKKDSLPIVAIPTTSGTGSEVTCVSVLTDHKNNIKAPVVHSNFYPKIAIIDPVLTITVPPYITASTGFDVLAHALEGFWSKNHQPICDALSIHAAKLVFENLYEAYKDGSNLEAREKLSEASVIAGLAFGLPKTAGSHACSYPLTSVYKIPHGEACAFTLDLFTRINAKADDRLSYFASQLGFDSPYEMADRILELKKMMNMKITLKDANIKLEDLDELSKQCMHPNMLNNPIEMNPSSIKNMFLSLNY